MLTARLLTLGVLGPDLSRRAHLPRHESKQSDRRYGIGLEGVAGIAQITQLHGKTQPIVRTAALVNNRQLRCIKYTEPRPLFASPPPSHQSSNPACAHPYSHP